MKKIFCKGCNNKAIEVPDDYMYKTCPKCREAHKKLYYNLKRGAKAKQGRQKKTKKEQICLQCGNKFSGRSKQRFCSHSCYYRWKVENNFREPRELKEPKPRPKREKDSWSFIPYEPPPRPIRVSPPPRPKKLCLWCRRELEDATRPFCQELGSDCSRKYYALRLRIIETFTKGLNEELKLLKELGQGYNLSERILLQQGMIKVEA